jgi:AbrB family looped-hinge helix DNA binding protein
VTRAAADLVAGGARVALGRPLDQYYLYGITTGEASMRVTAKGQVTIPQAIRDRAGMPPGVEVEFELGADGVVRLRRKAEQPDDPVLEEAILRLRGKASRTMTTEQILALTRG